MTLEKESVLKGRIIKGVGGLYTVIPENDSEKRVACNAKGTFRHEKITPTVGDHVLFEYIGEDKGFITDIEERKNLLIRPACANVDRLFIVACKENPKADIFTLDKLSAIAVKSGIEVIFIFNKCDIASADELEGIYTKAGFRVFCVSTAKEQYSPI